LRTVTTHKEQEWYELIFDATNSKEGQILVGYDIIPMHEKDAVIFVLMTIVSSG
jgi:hypothetical protein